MVPCQFCETLCPSNLSLVNHLWKFHQNRPSLQIPCTSLGCPQTFQKFTSLRSHLSRKHNGATVRLGVEEELGAVERDDQNDDDMGGDATIEENRQQGEDAPEDRIQEDGEPNLRTHNDHFSKDVAASFLLQLKSKNVTEPILDAVVENVSVLVKSCLNELKDEVSEALAVQGLDISNFVDVETIVDRLSSVFEDMGTKWLRNKAFKETLHLILARRIDLNTRVIRGCQANFGENRSSKVHSDTLMYVPIIDLIQKYLENPNFLELLQDVQPSEENILASYADGLKFKESEYFKLHPKALKPMLYYDDVNLVVDTSSTRPVNMAYFYLTFLDIHPMFRSLTRNIYLVLAVETEVMKGATVPVILEPVMEDLTKLESGIPGPGETTVHGSLFALLGDNLAAAKLAGTKEGFTAECCCRYCTASRELLRSLTLEDPALLRSVEQYEEVIATMKDHQEIIENPETSSRDRKTAKDAWEDLSKRFGINSECVFNKLETFHIVGGSAPDPYHDIILGCLARHLQLILRHYLVEGEQNNKVMTLKVFNEKLTGFDYGFSETKPSVVMEGHLKEGHSLHQTGSQMWSLATTVPFILGPLIEYEDEYWQNYLLLLQIMTLVFAHQISRRMVALLQFSIDEYLTDFMNLFDTHLIPKQHNLIHYPRLTLMFGPLKQFSTERFEGKHQTFVDMMKKFKCMKNPAFTTANQHQLMMGNLMTGPLIQLNEQGPVKKLALCMARYQNILSSDTVGNEILSVPWVKVNGVLYKSKKCFVIVGFNAPLLQFALIHDIIHMGSEFVFVCESFETVEMNFHFNAYQVSCLKDNFKLYKLQDFLCHETFHSHAICNEYFISVKRSVADLC